MYVTITTLWDQCLNQLETELPTQQFNMWLRPLQVLEDNRCLKLLAPNRFVLDSVKQQYFERIKAIVQECSGTQVPVEIIVGTSDGPTRPKRTDSSTDTLDHSPYAPGRLNPHR